MNKVRLFLVFCSLWFVAIGVSKAQSSCSEPADVNVGFFNGVNTEWDDGVRSLRHLPESVSPRVKVPHPAGAFDLR